jgi:hypothetical protein
MWLIRNISFRQVTPRMARKPKLTSRLTSQPQPLRAQYGSRTCSILRVRSSRRRVSGMAVEQASRPRQQWSCRRREHWHGRRAQSLPALREVRVHLRQERQLYPQESANPGFYLYTYDHQPRQPLRNERRIRDANALVRFQHHAQCSPRGHPPTPSTGSRPESTGSRRGSTRSLEFSCVIEISNRGGPYDLVRENCGIGDGNWWWNRRNGFLRAMSGASGCKTRVPLVSYLFKCHRPRRDDDRQLDE